MYIPLNNAAYSPNTLNNGFPRQANKTQGRGFFSALDRPMLGQPVRTVSSTFADVWSQPRLFFNSLTPIEQQLLINAIRFETAQLTSDVVKSNVLIQLNRVSHDVAVRVAEALDMTAPEADSTYYHDNTTIGVSASAEPLLKIDGLKVGYLTVASSASKEAAAALKSAFGDLNVRFSVVAERLGQGIDQTYSTTFAGQFDAIIIDGSVGAVFASPNSLGNSNSTASTNGNSSERIRTTLYPAGRPLQIIQDGYRWGKPVAVVGLNSPVFAAAGVETDSPGVYQFDASADATTIAAELSEGLYIFRFLDRYPLDQ